MLPFHRNNAYNIISLSFHINHTSSLYTARFLGSEHALGEKCLTPLPDLTLAKQLAVISTEAQGNLRLDTDYT
jgi:hypothetical protein